MAEVASAHRSASRGARPHRGAGTRSRAALRGRAGRSASVPRGRDAGTNVPSGADPAAAMHAVDGGSYVAIHRAAATGRGRRARSTAAAPGQRPAGLSSDQAAEASRRTRTRNRPRRASACVSPTGTWLYGAPDRRASLAGSAARWATSLRDSAAAPGGGGGGSVEAAGLAKDGPEWEPVRSVGAGSRVRAAAGDADVVARQRRRYHGSVEGNTAALVGGGGHADAMLTGHRKRRIERGATEPASASQPPRAGLNSDSAGIRRSGAADLLSESTGRSPSMRQLHEGLIARAGGITGHTMAQDPYADPPRAHTDSRAVPDAHHGRAAAGLAAAGLPRAAAPPVMPRRPAPAPPGADHAGQASAHMQYGPVELDASWSAMASHPRAKIPRRAVEPPLARARPTPEMGGAYPGGMVTVSHPFPAMDSRALFPPTREFDSSAEATHGWVAEAAGDGDGRTHMPTTAPVNVPPRAGAHHNPPPTASAPPALRTPRRAAPPNPLQLRVASNGARPGAGSPACRDEPPRDDASPWPQGTDPRRAHPPTGKWLRAAWDPAADVRRAGSPSRDLSLRSQERDAAVWLRHKGVGIARPVDFRNPATMADASGAPHSPAGIASSAALPAEPGQPHSAGRPALGAAEHASALERLRAEMRQRLPVNPVSARTVLRRQLTQQDYDGDGRVNAAELGAGLSAAGASLGAADIRALCLAFDDNLAAGAGRQWAEGLASMQRAGSPTAPGHALGRSISGGVRASPHPSLHYTGSVDLADLADWVTAVPGGHGLPGWRGCGASEATMSVAGDGTDLPPDAPELINTPASGKRRFRHRLHETSDNTAGPHPRAAPPTQPSSPVVSVRSRAASLPPLPASPALSARSWETSSEAGSLRSEGSRRRERVDPAALPAAGVASPRRGRSTSAARVAPPRQRDGPSNHASGMRSASAPRARATPRIWVARNNSDGIWEALSPT